MNNKEHPGRCTCPTCPVLGGRPFDPDYFYEDDSERGRIGYIGRKWSTRCIYCKSKGARTKRDTPWTPERQIKRAKLNHNIPKRRMRYRVINRKTEFFCPDCAAETGNGWSPIENFGLRQNQERVNCYCKRHATARVQKSKGKSKNKTEPSIQDQLDKLTEVVSKLVEKHYKGD